jgi:hypothetical protein
LLQKILQVLGQATGSGKPAVVAVNGKSYFFPSSRVTGGLVQQQVRGGRSPYGVPHSRVALTLVLGPQILLKPRMKLPKVVEKADPGRMRLTTKNPGKAGRQFGHPS